MYMLIYVCGNIFTYVGKINVLYLNHSYVSRLVDHGNSRWDSWKVFPVCYWTPRLVPSPPANMQGAGRTMVIRSADWTVSWKDVTSFFLIWRQRNPSVTLNFVYSNNNSPNRFSFPVVVVKLTSLCSFSPQQKQKFANFTGVTVTILHLLWSPSNSKYSLRIFRFWIFLHIINFFCEWNQLWYPSFMYDLYLIIVDLYRKLRVMRYENKLANQRLTARILTILVTWFSFFQPLACSRGGWGRVYWTPWIIAHSIFTLHECILYLCKTF